jgi:hypothetical protein
VSYVEPAVRTSLDTNSLYYYFIAKTLDDLYGYWSILTLIVQSKWMATLADFGIREVTDPGRIAAAEDRLREFSGSESLSLEQSVGTTREMDAERQSTSKGTSVETLMLGILAGAAVAAFVGTKLFGSQKSASSTSSGGVSPGRFTRASEENEPSSPHSTIDDLRGSMSKLADIARASTRPSETVEETKTESRVSS